MALSKIELAFGVTSVPVRIEPLIGDGTRPKGNYVCKQTKKPMTKASSSCGVQHEEPCSQVTGYPIAEDTWYVPDPDTLDSLNEEKSSTVTFSSRVPIAEVDPAYFAKTYAVTPRDDADMIQKKVFWLLCDVLKKQKQVMVAQAVLDKDEKMIVLRWSPVFNAPILTISVFDEQIRYERIAASQATRDGLSKPSKVEVDLLEQILALYVAEPFVATEWVPRRWHELNRIIEAARKGLPIKGKSKIETPTPSLFDLMQETIDQAKAKKKVKAA